MKHLKRHQVHRLPTEGYSSIGVHSSGALTYNYVTTLNDVTLQHLYFTTDEEIKEGDKGFIKIGKHGTIGTVSRDEKNNTWDLTTDDNVHYPFSSKKYIRKIIATTDPKLTINEAGMDTWKERKDILYPNKLPQPSQALIKAYCEQGGFDWVDVEYEDVKIIKGGTDLCMERQLKVDPIHGTITTHKIVEKMYSRKEMEDAFHAGSLLDISFDAYIKENL